MDSLIYIRISAMVFILASFIRNTSQSSSEMFVCYSDVCSQRGYFECSEIERRCKECAVFYTDTCGTERQPAGCYAYCTESLNQTLQEQLHSDEIKLADMAANNERVNDSNGHLRSEVLQLAEIINKLNNTNHHLQNDLTEMNSTKQRIEVNLTASAGKVLSLKKLFEEERSTKKKWIVGLSVGLVTLFILVTVVVCAVRKCRYLKRMSEQPTMEHRMSEFAANTETNIENVDENANARKADVTPIIAANDIEKDKIKQSIEDTNTADDTQLVPVENLYQNIDNQNIDNQNIDNSPDSKDRDNDRKPTQESGISSPSECVAS